MFIVALLQVIIPFIEQGMYNSGIIMNDVRIIMDSGHHDKELA